MFMYDHTTIPRVTSAQNSSEVHLDGCVHRDPLHEELQGFASILTKSHGGKDGCSTTLSTDLYTGSSRDIETRATEMTQPACF